MSQHFNACFQKGKIKKFSRGKVLFIKELKLAEEDLKSAKKSFQEKAYSNSVGYRNNIKKVKDG